MQFSYTKKEYKEGEVRMARIRAQYAQQGRLKARRFAEAEKRPTNQRRSRSWELRASGAGEAHGSGASSPRGGVRGAANHVHHGTIPQVPDEAG